MKIKFILFGIAAIIAAFLVGVASSPYFQPSLMPVMQQIEERESYNGLVDVNVTINGNTIFLSHECKAITFDVTDDQALSIFHGTEGTYSMRPLTHDIFIDVADTFNINITQVKIDRYEDGIYKARMTLKHENKILDLDIRPSDAISIGSRLKLRFYVDENVMNSKSIKVC